MKTIVAIFFVLTLIQGLNVYSQSRISDRQLMNLGIAITEKDLSKAMNFKNAKLACQKLGKQWRLPEIDEMESAVSEYGMNELKENAYWCTQSGESYPYIAVELGLFAGAAYYPTQEWSVRCVRKLRPSEMGE